MKPSRRTFLSAALVSGTGLVGLRCGLPWALRPGPVKEIGALSPEARTLVEEAFRGVRAERMWDVHTHVVGLGSGSSGCRVNPRMRSHLHPLERLRYELYFAAAGVGSEERADEEYLERLLALHRAANPAGKLCLLAFDEHVRPDGEVDEALTPFHTPNDYVVRLASQAEDLVAVASVHPYRKDAIARLEKAIEGGAVACKWLPNAMGIDPASPRCDAFYRVLAEHRVALLTHTGLEKAVHAAEFQRLGNPLRLRRPLDAGVTVLAAHCASLGEDRDLDAAGDDEERESFDLFLRLMQDSRYEANLFGEISALTQLNRCGRPLRELLRAEELHPRLVNGSDYPLPAIDLLVSTRQLSGLGYLDEDEQAPLREVFLANPLLFDFVLKRRLRWSEGGQERRFAPVVFESSRVFQS